MEDAMSDGQGSWKCGGCGTWYAYWVSKCECAKKETASAPTPIDATAGAYKKQFIPYADDDRVYSIPAWKPEA
jgi:hypothetical protein